MGRFVFKLPDVGEGIAEAEIVKWHVKAGDRVHEGQALADIMTDKATVEIAAPVAGIIRATTGSEGSKLAVGAELAVIETAGNETPEAVPRAPGGGKPDEEAAPAPVPKPTGKVLAAPAVRARAKSLAIDLTSVAGSGPGGRVEHGDLDRLLAKHVVRPTPALAPLPEGAEDIKIFGLRRRIAERMLDAKRRVPHFAFVEEIDVTALEQLRRQLNGAGRQGVHLTVLPFLIRAIIAAIARHPVINSHFEDAQGVIRRFTPVHAGIATQTERGLLVPVIHNAQNKDLWQLAAEIARLSEEARAENRAAMNSAARPSPSPASGRSAASWQRRSSIRRKWRLSA